MVNYQKIKVNYVIASWNGPRISPISKPNYYENVLKNHIYQISSIEHNLTKITIMKPESKYVNSYYDIDYGDNIEVINCPNQYQSYGQWLNAIEMFVDEYDYFILIEDDYIPNIDNFDSKLIEIYEEGTFLCSMISKNIIEHCGISNGIISSKTIKDLIKQNNFISWFNNYTNVTKTTKLKNGIAFGGTNYQIVFSRYFADNNIVLKDYLNHYGADFHYRDKIIDYSINSNEKIITPIQNIL